MDKLDGLQSEVGSTASWVAVARGWETQRGGFLNDPLAHLMVSPEFFHHGAEMLQQQHDRLAGSAHHASAPSQTVGDSSDSQQSRIKRTPFIALRARRIDDAVLDSARRYADQGHTHVQVVMLGAGLDSRPWRLDLPGNVHWFEVDTQDMVEIKLDRLLAAGADTSPRDTGSLVQPLEPEPPEPSQKCGDFPLKVQRWTAVAADVGSGGGEWMQKLVDEGFESDSPTIWVAEGLLYYLGTEDVAQLLTTVAKSSAPGSTLVASHMSQSHAERSRAAATAEGCKTSYVAKLWVSWVSDDPARDFTSWGWKVDSVESNKELDAKYGVKHFLTLSGAEGDSSDTGSQHEGWYYVVSATNA